MDIIDKNAGNLPRKNVCPDTAEGTVHARPGLDIQAQAHNPDTPAPRFPLFCAKPLYRAPVKAPWAAEVVALAAACLTA